MSKWNITDQESGDTLTIEADRAPTQADADEIFKTRAPQPKPQDLSNIKANPMQQAEMAGAQGPNATFEQYAATHDPSQSKPPEPGVVDKAWQALNYNPIEEQAPIIKQRIERGSQQLQAYRQSAGAIAPDFTDPVTAGAFRMADIPKELGLPTSKKYGWSERDVEALQEPPKTPVIQNIVEGLLDTGSSFVTPLGELTLGTGTALKSLPAGVQRTIALSFAAQMAAQTPEIGTQLGEEFGKPKEDRDYGKIAALWTKFTTTSAFAGLAAAHGLTLKGAQPYAQAIRSDAGQVQVPRDVQQGGEVQSSQNIQQPPSGTPSDKQAPRAATAEQILLTGKPTAPWRLRMGDDGTFHIIDPQGNHVESFAADALGEAKKRIDRLERGLDKPPAPVKAVSDEEAEYLRKEAEGMGIGVDVTDAPSSSGNEPFARQISTIDRKAGKILIRPKAYADWLKTVPEGRRDMAKKSLLWEERLHLSNTDAEATEYLGRLSALEKRIAQRRYRGPNDTTPMSDIELGHEALRYRQQQLMNMTPREVAEAALRERWTLKGLDAVDSVVRNMREIFGHESGDKIAQSIIDRMQQNISSAKSAIGAAPSATAKEQERPRFDYTKLSADEKAEYGRLHSEAMTARQDYDKLSTGQSADKLIDAERALSSFETARGALPKLVPGERVVTVKKPDGTTYQASFGDKYWKGMGKNGADVAMIGRPTPTGWSHGALGPGEQIVEGHEPSARMKKGKYESADQGTFFIPPPVSEVGQRLSPEERTTSAEHGALPALSASELEGHAANWMQPVVSAGKVPEFNDFVDYMKGKQPELKAGQLTELWQKSVFDYLTKAPGAELSKLAGEVYGKESTKGKARVIADLPTPEEMRNPQHAVYRSGVGPEKLGAETIRTAQQKREKVISDLAYELVGPRLKDADLTRKAVSPDELRYGGGKDISAAQEFSERDATNPDLLGRQLVDEARRSKRDPVSVTKRVTAVMDRRTGKVNLVSTYDDGRRGAVLYDPGALQHTPIKDMLKRYRVIASYLLDEPVKDFNQRFDSLKDFNDRFAMDAHRQYSAETSYQPPPAAQFEEGVEGTPGLETEGGTFSGGPGKAASAIAQGVAHGAVETFTRTPLSDAEATAVQNHINDDLGGEPANWDDVRTVMDNLAIGKEHVSAAARIGFMKVARMIQREHPTLDNATLMDLMAKRIYEDKNLEATVARSKAAFSPKTIAFPRPVEPTGREITTIRTKAPTYDPAIVTGKGPGPEAKLAPPTGPEMLSPKQQRQLERRLRAQYEPSATQKKGEEADRGLMANVTISLKEFLAKSAMTAAATGQLSDRLHQLGTMAKADYIQALPILKSAASAMTPEDGRALMKYADDMQVMGTTDVKLTPFQKEVYDGTVGQLMDANKNMFDQLRKMGASPGESTYFARIVKDTHSLFENIRRGVRHGVVEGGVLGKTASFLKRRSMKVLVDDAGDRQVVSIKYGTEKHPGSITAWTDKKPTDMGKFQFSDMQTNDQRMTEELKPVWQKSQEIRNQIGYLESLKLDPAAQTAADKRIMRLRGRLAESLADEDFIRAQYDPLTADQKTWKDANGKRWRVTDGTISEIEKNSDVQYYKDPITTLMSQFLKLRQIHRAAKFLEDFKTSPEFSKIAAPITDRNVPEHWRQTELPQFRGYRFEPTIADALDQYYHEHKSAGWGLRGLSAVNTFLRDSTFTLQPFIHDPNLLANFFFARGLMGSWANPKAWMWLARTGTKAFVDVATKSPDYLKALRAGAPLLHFRMRGMIDEYTRLLESEFMKGPPLSTQISHALGYANPLKLLGSLGFHASWGLNDILTLQLINEAQARYGMDLDEAIHAVGKNMVDYRMPSRILGTTFLPRAMSNPNLFMFGRYHYGVLKTIGEQFKNVASKSPVLDKARSLDRIAAGVFLMAAFYPMMDAIIQKIGNDKKLKMRRAGVTSIPYNLMRMMKQEETPSEFIQSVFTPAIFTKAAVEAAVNRDFQTGARIYNPSHGLGEAAKSLAKFGAEAVAPVKIAENLASGGETAKAVGVSMLGITRGGQDDLQQVQSLAAKWREKAGIDEPEILLSKDEPSYQKLRHALANNDNSAGEVYKELLKGHTQKQVDKAMKAWSKRPFTGSRKHEQAFIDSLSADEKKIYYRALDQKEALLQRYYAWSMKQGV